MRVGGLEPDGQRSQLCEAEYGTVKSLRHTLNLATELQKHILPERSGAKLRCQINIEVDITKVTESQDHGKANWSSPTL